MRYQFENNNLRRNQYKIWEYLNSVSDDWFFKNFLASQLDMFPDSSLRIISSIQDTDDKLSRFFGLLTGNHNIAITIGGKGSGKTTFNKWILSVLESVGYEVFYRNPDFILPSSWRELSYSDDFPYKSLFEYLLGSEQSSFQEAVNNVRGLYAQGLMKKKIAIVHDELSLDVDSKNYASKSMKYLRDFLRELRKLGLDVVVIYTDVLATNISIDFIRQVNVKIFKNVSEASLKWERESYFDDISFFIPKQKTDTLVIFERENQFIYLQQDLSEVVI